MTGMALGSSKRGRMTLFLRSTCKGFLLPVSLDVGMPSGSRCPVWVSKEQTRTQTTPTPFPWHVSQLLGGEGVWLSQVSSIKRLSRRGGHRWRHRSSVRVAVTSRAVGSRCYKALGKFGLISHSISPTTGMKVLKKIYIEQLQRWVQTLQKMKQI